MGVDPVPAYASLSRNWCETIFKRDKLQNKTAKIAEKKFTVHNFEMGINNVNHGLPSVLVTWCGHTHMDDYYFLHGSAIEPMRAKRKKTNGIEILKSYMIP